MESSGRATSSGRQSDGDRFQRKPEPMISSGIWLLNGKTVTDRIDEEALVGESCMLPGFPQWLVWR